MVIYVVYSQSCLHKLYKTIKVSTKFQIIKYWKLSEYS